MTLDEWLAAVDARADCARRAFSPGMPYARQPLGCMAVEESQRDVPALVRRLRLTVAALREVHEGRARFEHAPGCTPAPTADRCEWRCGMIQTWALIDAALADVEP